jgi:hypothetical protein
MLKRMRRCANCDAEIESLRSTKTYCSDACRKKAARGETDLDRKVSSSWMVEHLFGMGLIGKVWPVYAWDDSPAIYVLMTTIQNALDELNAVAPDLGWKQVTESEFTRTMNLWKIETSDSGPKLQAAIKAFYDARKDRRIGKGYTPSDKGKLKR